MVFTRKDGIFMGYVSLPEGNYVVSNSSLIPMITGIFFWGGGLG